MVRTQNHNEAKYINNLKLLYRTHHKGWFIYIFSNSKGATSSQKTGTWGSLFYISADMHYTKQDCAQREKNLNFSVVKIYKFLPEIS